MSEETIPQMRDRIDSLEKGNKDQASEIVRLTGENRSFAARDAFRNEGYAANHGDLYAASHPEGEITADGVNEFAGQFNLPKVEIVAPTDNEEGSTEEGDQSSEDAGSTELADMARGGSRPGDSAGGATQDSMTRAEWQALMQSDPVAGREAVSQGKVQISRDNPWGDGQPVTPGSNPYAGSPE